MERLDYEAIRERNIAERNAFFAEFFRDLEVEKSELNALGTAGSLVSDKSEDENLPPMKRRRISTSKKSRSPKRRWQRRNYDVPFRKKYNTRYSLRNNTSDSVSDDSTEENTNGEADGPKLRVLFPWATPFERQIKLMTPDVFDEYESEDEKTDGGADKKQIVHRITRSDYDPDSIPSPDEITEEQMSNIAEKSTKKIYSKEHGTSCHQCRQKTLDTKTVCRSGQCIGVRGQFCGPCLRGRYGEDAATALKDENWMCPPCRGLCNCSICRKRNGQQPTGILAPIAQEEGFNSVKDYLQSADD